MLDDNLTFVSFWVFIPSSHPLLSFAMFDLLTRGSFLLKHFFTPALFQRPRVDANGQLIYLRCFASVWRNIAIYPFLCSFSLYELSLLHTHISQTFPGPWPFLSLPLRFLSRAASLFALLPPHNFWSGRTGYPSTYRLGSVHRTPLTLRLYHKLSLGLFVRKCHRRLPCRRRLRRPHHWDRCLCPVRCRRLLSRSPRHCLIRRRRRLARPPNALNKNKPMMMQRPVVSTSAQALTPTRCSAIHTRLTTSRPFGRVLPATPATWTNQRKCIPALPATMTCVPRVLPSWRSRDMALSMTPRTLSRRAPLALRGRWVRRCHHPALSRLVRAFPPRRLPRRRIPTATSLCWCKNSTRRSSP